MTLAFADDIAIMGTSEQIGRKLKIVEEWCKANNITMNARKSNILIMKQDQRTKYPDKAYQNIPVVQNSKYLGVHLDDDFSFKTEIKLAKDWLKKNKYQLKRIEQITPG